MIQKVIDTINKFNMIEKKDKIVVAVSGGPDSMTLLHILIKLKEKYDLTIYVAHINHLIRENAKIDEQYVKESCDKNNIKCFILREDVIKKSKQNKMSVEETGRCVRYDFFEKVLKDTNSNKIAIAHNLNDNIETIIMNAMRGTGPLGLKGIEPKRGKYIRPLIEIEREEIEKYCMENNINPKHDESNDDNTYTRNKIRNVVIPYIKKEFNPNIINGLNRLSEIVKEEEEYINNQVKSIYSQVIISDKEKVIFDLKKFNMQDILIQKRLILLAIDKIFGNKKGIEKVNLDDIIKLCNNNIGNKYLKPNGKTKIEIRDKKIIISNDEK